MANQTVYPYGTGGSLPSGISIINDYITGGADKALSAEKGKDLNERLSFKTNILNAWDKYSGIVATSTYVKDNNTRYFGVISPSGFDTIEVTAPIANETYIAFVKSFNPSFTNGSSVDFCAGEERIQVNAGETRMFAIPSDCTHILVNIESSGVNYTPTSMFAFSDGKLGETNDAEMLQLNVVFGAYNSVTGAFSSGATRRSTSIIDVSAYRRLRTNSTIPSGVIAPYWYDENGIFLYRGTILNSSGGYVEFDIPTPAKKVAFLLALDATTTDLSGIRIFGIKGGSSENESDNDCLEVYLSDFWNDGQTADENIADMMGFVSKATKKVVHFDRDVTISSVILLESNTTVYIDGVTIKQADGMFDNVFRSANIDLSGYEDYVTMPSVINEMENIRIVGVGNANIVGPDVNAVDGQGHEMVGGEYGNRTWQICLIRVDGGEISGITFTKTRMWAIEMELCSHIELHHLYIVSNVKNGDGIDFRVGCKHCFVHHIYGFTTDDLIACTALGDLSFTDDGLTYTYNVSWKIWNALVEQDPTALYIEDIRVENVEFQANNMNGTWPGGHGMICLSAYGSKVLNISISNFLETIGSENEEALIKVYYGYGSGYSDGDIDNIRIDKATANGATYVLMLAGGVITDIWANKLVNRNTPANIISQSAGNNAKITNS